MLNKPLEKIVFIDIETTTQYPTFAEMPAHMKRIFEKKYQKEIQEAKICFEDLDNPLRAIEEVYNVKGPLFAELNKIVCISRGMIDTRNPKEYKLLVKSICGDDEKAILEEFIKLPSVVADPKENKFYFCAHNGKIFDFHVLAKRIRYNELELPKMLDYAEEKPWDTEHLIDTKAVWKFGVYDGGVSLDMLAAAFNLESPKNHMSGELVKDAYYLLKDLKGIQDYCEFDVLTLARVYLKMKNIQTPLVR